LLTVTGKIRYEDQRITRFSVLPDPVGARAAVISVG